MGSSPSADVKCSTCSRKDIVTFCLVCREPNCGNCLKNYGHMGATKHHCTINISSGEICNLEEGQLNCFSCKNEILESMATPFCPVCKELMCQKCYVFHSKSRFTKHHQATMLSHDGHSTTTTVPSKMAGKKKKKVFDDGQFASDLEGVVHITSASSIDFTVSQAPLKILSSGAVTVDKCGGVSNVTTQSVTNMAYFGDLDINIYSDTWGCDLFVVMNSTRQSKFTTPSISIATV